ncbi:dihydroorotase [Planctomycetales bacterium]|nr:dihydroorotase [Planctomycetales bacterium]GHT35434.1 dihydroorotase [Planctomycetales bacterium]
MPHSNIKFIINGRVIDPSQKLDEICTIRIEDGKIAEITAGSADGGLNGDYVYDAARKTVVPGLIDMHVHLREPGTEEDETIETGTKAAIHGGFTSVACCPNTVPPVDSQATVELIQQQAARSKNCNVFVMCCISKNREGKELAELGQLFSAGAVACSDDGSPVEDAELMRRALEYCLMFDKPLLSHSENTSLTNGGVMNEGIVSMQLGLRGIPAAGEDVAAAQDIALAEATGGKLHLMHVSTAGAVSMVRRAKERNVKITAEVTPHHLTLTDAQLRSFDTNFKMSPPLRSGEHVEACIAGLLDGTIDVIASDHAPHALEKKMRELDQAPFGIVGLETSLSLIITKFVKTGIFNWSTLVEKMSVNPAKILNLNNKGSLQVGKDADITVIDPDIKWTVSKEGLYSKSKNSPYIGWELCGKAVAVFVGGERKV